MIYTLFTDYPVKRVLIKPTPCFSVKYEISFSIPDEVLCL